MAWRNYKLTKKSFRFYEDGFHPEGRVFVTLPKNNIYPAGYGFSVNPSMADKNFLYMADDYKLDICIDPELREKGIRYKHFKMRAGQLYEELLNKYEEKIRELTPKEKSEYDSLAASAKQMSLSDYESKIYGYCRISRKEQSIDRQIRNIKAKYPTAIILQEAYTGTKMDRPEWTKLVKKVQAGDKIVFDSVSRMARLADEGVQIYFELYEKGIQLIFLKEKYINTDVYAENLKDKIELQGTDEDEIFKGLNNYFRKLAEKQIRIAFEQAEKEVMDLRQRTREGIETARLNGKQIGQAPGKRLKVKKEGPAKEQIRKYSKDFDGTLKDSECIRLIGISRNTYYKYKRELLYS